MSTAEAELASLATFGQKKIWHKEDVFVFANKIGDIFVCFRKMRKYDVFCSRSRFLLIKSMNYDLCDLDFRTALIMSLWRKCLSLARSPSWFWWKWGWKEGIFEETRNKQMIGQANSSIFAATYLLMPTFVLQMK